MQLWMCSQLTPAALIHFLTSKKTLSDLLVEAFGHLIKMYVSQC